MTITRNSVVRHALGLEKRDTIQYRINADGSVLMARMDQVNVDSIDSLTAGVPVDLESVLNDSD